MWFLDCQPNLIDRRNESLPSVESVFGFVFVSCVADEGTEVADTGTWGLADVDIMISYFSYKMRMYQEEKTNSIIYIKIE